MVFNSLTFLVFFAGVCILHYLPFSWTVKKFNLLLASYLFYAAWNPPFVLLLIISAVVDFFLARWIHRIEWQTGRRLLLITSLSLNLGLLGYFKYGTFLLENFIDLLALIGIHYQAATPNIILPLGISFYTFETISYLVDVYTKRIKPWNSFLDYALFLTFFPHLVAGPIVRANDFLPQCQTPKQASSNQFNWGLCLLLFGLFEKVILADAIMAPVADRVYQSVYSRGVLETWRDPSFLDAWIGTLAFAGQIFFDFAGYSTCGIGVALCLGFVLNDNFRFPYAAIGFSDFWQRWHISLSSWLRDYLYIPLGGNRKGPVRTYANLLVTMLLGGLWHGASWRFIAWGGLHGLYLMGERALKALWGDRAFAKSGIVRVGLAMGTFVLVCITWVFFRAPDFATAFALLSTMFTPARGLTLLVRSDMVLVLGITLALLTSHWLLRDSSLEETFERLPVNLRAVAVAGLLVALVLAPGDDRAFIYFQF